MLRPSARATDDVPRHDEGTETDGRRMLADGAQQNLADNMNALMNAFCRYQSGADCGEIDWTGNTDWYRK